MKNFNLLLIALGFSTLMFGQDVVNNSFGQGFYNVIAADSSYSMKFAARKIGRASCRERV